MQGGKDDGLTTYCFFLDVQKAYDTVFMAKWTVEKAVGSINRDQRKDVESDKNDDGMCQTCCDA